MVAIMSIRRGWIIKATIYRLAFQWNHAVKRTVRHFGLLLPLFGFDYISAFNIVFYLSSIVFAIIALRVVSVNTFCGHYT